MREEENNTEVCRYAKDKCRTTFSTNQPQSKLLKSEESGHPAEGEEGGKHICKKDVEVTEASKGWEGKADTVQKQAARELLTTLAWPLEPAVHLGSSNEVSKQPCKDPRRGEGWE